MFGSTHSKDFCVLLNDAQKDEIRKITLYWDSEGNCTLVERSDGALTMECFGVLSHACVISIDATQVAALAERLEYDASSWKEALQDYFSTQGSYLADLQDRLDHWRVAYKVAVLNGGEVALRLDTYLEG